MYTSKIGNLIDDAITDCIVYGRGAIVTPKVTVTADWMENEKDIEVNFIQDGRVVATLVEANAIEEEE